MCKEIKCETAPNVCLKGTGHINWLPHTLLREGLLSVKELRGPFGRGVGGNQIVARSNCVRPLCVWKMLLLCSWHRAPTVCHVGVNGFASRKNVGVPLAALACMSFMLSATEC